METAPVPSYLSERGKALGRMLREGRYLEAAGFVGSTVRTGSYETVLRDQASNGHVTREVHDLEMALDVTDRGLSRELAWRRIHEPRSTAVWRRELRSLREGTESVTLLEAGANIGYYCLLAASVLGEDAEILAVEPVERNRELLEKNVAGNGFDGRVSIFPYGFSDEAGERQLFISDKSNCARVGSEPEFGDVVERVSIETTTVDAFLRERGRSPSDLTAMRMDVEGHESRILRGMTDVLRATRPRLLFVELHRRVVEEGDLEDVFDRLGGFELVSGHCEPVFGPMTTLDSLAEVREFDFETHENVELILRRP